MEYGFVAVAAGEGLRGLFRDLGAEQCRQRRTDHEPEHRRYLGGESSATPAKTVFVLPNNKNIIMAAEQAVQLADRKVCVVADPDHPAGASAMLAFDPDASFDDNRANMTEGVRSGP